MKDKIIVTEPEFVIYEDTDGVWWLHQRPYQGEIFIW